MSAARSSASGANEMASNVPIGEQPSVTRARQARLAQRYPVFQTTPDPTTVLGVDSYRASNGMAPSQFSQVAMRLAAAASARVKQPDMPPEMPTQ